MFLIADYMVLEVSITKKKKTKHGLHWRLFEDSYRNFVCFFIEGQVIFLTRELLLETYSSLHR